MPRKPREFEIGDIYHIVKRGTEKRKIFMKSQDYSRFVLGLEFFNDKNPINIWRLVARAGSDPARHPTERKSVRERLIERRQKGHDPLVKILAFSLMPNHFHLVLQEIIEGGISAFMGKMGGYSTYFNQQYDREGSLFQSRYKVVPIKTDAQLAVIFSYVHTNPVELYEPGWKEFKVKEPEKAFHKLEQYRWSSYRDYIGIPTFPAVTQRDFYLEFFNGRHRCREEIEAWIKYKAQASKIDPKEME